MKKEMLINVLQPEECRIAILEDGVLEELYVERTSHESYVGNIYKGRVVNIEPSIQAAFIDFGVGRNGFLHVSDVEQAYYRHVAGGDEERDRDKPQQRRGRGRRRSSSSGRGKRPRRDADPAGTGASALALASEWTAFVEATPVLPEIDFPIVEELIEAEYSVEVTIETETSEAMPSEPGGFGAGLDLPEAEPEATPVAEAETASTPEPQELPETNLDGGPEEPDEEIIEPQVQTAEEPETDGFGAGLDVPVVEPGPKAGSRTSPATPGSKRGTASTPRPTVMEDVGFGEGLDLEDAAKAQSEPAEVEVEAEVEPEAELVVAEAVEPTETLTESEKDQVEEDVDTFGEGLEEVELAPTAELPSSEEADEEAEADTGDEAELVGAEAVEEEEEDETIQAPQWMESAEHRTEPEVEIEPTSETEAEVEPEQSGSAAVGSDVDDRDIQDEDISFGEGSEPVAETTEEDSDRESTDLNGEPIESQEETEEESDEESIEEDVIPEREWVEPSIDRSIPIERELEEDLREADVDPGSAGSSWGDDEVFDEPEFRSEPSERRPRRSDNRRGGDRGDRGDRSDRGDRGDRRGGRGRGGDRRRRNGGGGGGPRREGRPKPLIQDVFKRGQEVLVQVIKEGLGAKGPTLSTYISIAGRYLVLMPGLNRVGVSRKIMDDDQRRRLRDIFVELQPPKGLGFIIRTAGEDRSKKELARDLSYLSRLWQVVVRRIRKGRSPQEIYQESDMITRTIRDTFTGDIDTIWVDERNAFEHAQEFMQIVMPRYADRIKFYDGKQPMFHKYGIEDEIQRIQHHKVPLPKGGSIVIEQTEALVAIDVNSGNYRADSNNAEETAYQMNVAAAKEIARQLRLRDLGGVIVNDFIDMRDEKHRRGVERALREAVKRDRARTKVLRISAFGIIEMTRQRIRPSLNRSTYHECPHCSGTGLVKTSESVTIEVMRLLRLAVFRDHVRRLEVRVTEVVALDLQNRKRKDVAELEETGNVQISILGVPAAPPEFMELTCYDAHEHEVAMQPEPPASRSGRRR